MPALSIPYGHLNPFLVASFSASAITALPLGDGAIVQSACDLRCAYRFGTGAFGLTRRILAISR
jgi:hypothetical protein